MPLKINPPGTPFEPGHPFATPKILFVPRYLAARRANAHGQLPATAQQIVKNADAGYVRFRQELLDVLQEQQRLGCHEDNEVIQGDVASIIPAHSHAQSTEALVPPLVPQKPPDLEDIAFEILRQRYIRR